MGEMQPPAPTGDRWGMMLIGLLAVAVLILIGWAVATHRWNAKRYDSIQQELQNLKTRLHSLESSGQSTEVAPQ